MVNQPRDTIAYEKIAGRGTAYLVFDGDRSLGVVRLTGRGRWVAAHGRASGSGATRREAVGALLGRLAEMETDDA